MPERGEVLPLIRNPMSKALWPPMHLGPDYESIVASEVDR